MATSTMDRETLIHKINSSRVKDVLVPTTVFGKPGMIKTTKHDIVQRIKSEYGTHEPTKLRIRILESINSIVVESINAANQAVAAASAKDGGKKATAAKPGRKPKVSAANA